MSQFTSILFDKNLTNSLPESRITQLFRDYSQTDLLIRAFTKDNNNAEFKLPQKINDICMLFIFQLDQYIPFSSKYKSQKGLKLTENNECVTKLEYTHSTWIVSDIEPVHDGVHCWRVFVDNPDQDFIRFGVGSKRMFSVDSVWGIAYDTKLNRNNWKPSGHINQRNKINLKHFAQKKCQVDMLLNVDAGTLRFCVVGMNDNEHEAKMWGMPTVKLYNRWVPQFIFGSKGINIKLRVKEINHRYYGKEIESYNPLIKLEKYFDSTPRKSKIIKENDSLMFYFYGIRRPKEYESTPKISLFKNIETDSVIKVESELNISDSIYCLKELIRKTYHIPSINDILILYSNNIISFDNQLKLQDFGVTDGCLFLLGIIDYSYCIKRGWTCIRCTYLNEYDRSKCEMCENPKKHSKLKVIKVNHPFVHELYNLSNKSIKPSYYDDKLSIKPIKGFDIITQETNVDVYKMPDCNHLMSKESLYQYVMTRFMNENNVYLQCPHPNEEEKSDEWPCLFCTYLNDIDRSVCEMCQNAKPKKKKFCETKWEYSLIKQILLSSSKDSDFANNELIKLELLASRNKIQKACDVQKCARCNTLYYRKDDKNKLSVQDISSVDTVKDHFKTKCVLCEYDRNMDTDYIEELPMSSLMMQAKGKPFGTLPFGFEQAIRWKPVNNDCKVKWKYVEDITFCWGCGKQWHCGHFCDSSFKKDLVEILKKAERKKIGSVNDVPSIRCCPNCCQLITHTEACKHMKCGSCKTDFCFICLKLKTNGNWQCGTHSDVCPVAANQNMTTLPDTIVVNKKTFKLF